jgi:hypothetical protein
MNNNDYGNFDWDELLERIESKKIIPVIGQGLYRIEDQGKEVLLYDYLAEKLTREIGMEPFPDVSQKFAKAAFEYLKRKNNNYLKLSKFLSALIREVKPTPHSTLWKLARVKAFNIFINTAYDDFLVNTIKTVRDFPTEVHFYTLREKKLNRLEDQLFDELEESKRTLVFNLYGNVNSRLDSAFTEKDILETIVEFQKDIKTYPENNLFQALEGSSLLFMGCGYDDWLFRFFIRTIANEPYRIPKDPHKCMFICDNLFQNKKDPFQELPQFLKEYESEIYYSPAVKEFVDILFEKLEKDFPGTIIARDDFPRTVFISFHGANRAIAARLASHLREDGIDVWLDEREFEPGAEVDDTIAKAINKCPAFVPLISRETQKIQAENGVLKYHCREWEWGYGNMKAGKNPKTIIPVNIDGIDWIYDKFAGLFYISIPGGERVGGYEDLKKKLLEIQRQIDG